MPWYALDALDDAREATEGLLVPLSSARWLRLAVIAFFVGGVGGSVSVNGESGVTADVPVGRLPLDPPSTLPSFPSRTLLLAATLAVVAAIVVGIAYAVVGAVMEFVLFESLRTGDVRVRERFRRYLGAGGRLFAFRLLVWAITAVVVLGPLAAVVLVGRSVTPLAVLLALPVFGLVAVAGLLALVVLRLTTDFVVPTMLAEGRTPVDAWRRFYGVLEGRWAEFGLYVVVRLALGIVAAVAVGLVTLLVGLAVAVPFALGGGAYLALVSAGEVGPLGWAAFGALGTLYLLALLCVSLLAQVPVVTFLRYYALAVLGRADPTLDLVGVESGGDETAAVGG